MKKSTPRAKKDNAAGKAVNNINKKDR